MDRLIDIYKAIGMKKHIKPEVAELKNLLGNEQMDADEICEELLKLYSGILGLDGIINSGHN